MVSNGGKGSTQRPTNQDAFAQAWERIFGAKPSDELEKQYRDVPKGADGACGHPFCKCVEICEERK